MTYPWATGGAPESHEKVVPEIVCAISAVWFFFSVRFRAGFGRRFALGLWIVLLLTGVRAFRFSKNKKTLVATPGQFIPHAYDPDLGQADLS